MTARAPAPKPNQSLAQWVAAAGGVSLASSKHGREGEVARIREANKRLRGRRRVVSVSGGIPYDRLAIYAREHGFQVDEDTFLDELDRDATALAVGDVRNRVYVDYELTDADLTSAFDFDPCAWEHVHTDEEHSPCSVCGKACQDGICPECLNWAVETTRELLLAKERTRAVEAYFETMRGT